ncbi:hypothetical protein Malapachy_3915 [Malassezia pachydermatis]|uniref:Uncharacterized protein n=1 Tax=Malassezia pachydermatis TaxID=77020 RepID=A0A0M8MK72_9BASI|nr:hypothetical protein Malapachy_3915 [Malassezia pachydermatis]KOS14126.1 hypothetical protein Malapachy_3915 [Malassezia pachydermatis]
MAASSPDHEGPSAGAVDLVDANGKVQSSSTFPTRTEPVQPTDSHDEASDRSDLPYGSDLSTGNPKRVVLAPVLRKPVDKFTPIGQDLDPGREHISVEEWVPIHHIYTEREWRQWRALQQTSHHRLYTNDVSEKAPPHPTEESQGMDSDSIFLKTRRYRLQDTVGWMTQRLADRSSEDTEKPPADPMTLNRTESAGWNEPWSFKNALGDEKEDKVGVMLFGAEGQKKVEAIEKKVFLFLMRKPIVPILFRVINIVLISTTLAVGTRLHIALSTTHNSSAVGVSPLTAVIFSPPSLVYALFQVWIEFQSRPIGLWRASAKLWYMMLELVFVCLWSAELALAFDNYFTSAIVCVHTSSPFYAIEDSMVRYLPNKDTVCGLQISLICVTFVSVLVYLMVFLVSLFRIFYRVVLMS